MIYSCNSLEIYLHWYTQNLTVFEYCWQNSVLEVLELVWVSHEFFLWWPHYETVMRQDDSYLSGRLGDFKGSVSALLNRCEAKVLGPSLRGLLEPGYVFFLPLIPFNYPIIPWSLKVLIKQSKWKQSLQLKLHFCPHHCQCRFVFLSEIPSHCAFIFPCETEVRWAGTAAYWVKLPPAV